MDTRKIVIMGGSFNPPTLAHYLLLKTAAEALDAEKGFFVPVSEPYLKRKMRGSHPPVVLSSELRMQMLESICRTEDRLEVSDMELQSVQAQTLITMARMQERYPDAELYFLLGADKLFLLSHWGEAFFENYHAVVFFRDDINLEELISTEEMLSKYRNRLVLLSQPEGVEGISSTEARRLMLSGQSSEHLLCPEVWEMFRQVNPSDYPDEITRFKEEYEFLSNSYPSRIVYEGLEFSCAESAFQSTKCKDEKEKLYFTTCTADKARQRGGKITPEPSWEERRLSLMESVLRAKFTQHPELMEQLKATGGIRLINGGNDKNTFWGVGLYSQKGENQLGRLLMKIREEELRI